ncbi:hypothetical protein [Streptomyces sp900116325]|uniref:hypothetical protein n=1 Tax=Streptomyces sp. 900116325 TaxID=3154295 RepID=UPI0033BAFAAD
MDHGVPSLAHPLPGRSGRTPALPTTPSDFTNAHLAQRLAAHSSRTGPQLTGLHIRHRRALAYIDGELADGDALMPMRLRYTGSADS